MLSGERNSRTILLSFRNPAAAANSSIGVADVPESMANLANGLEFLPV